MKKPVFHFGRFLFGVTLACGLGATAEAAPPVTDGLFIQLDNSNLGADGTPVGIWTDQATSEDDSPLNNHQDFGAVNFGQENPSAPGTFLPDQRPTVMVTTMPGGSSQKTLNFVRGTLPNPPVSNNISGLPTSSRLASALNGEIAAGNFVNGGDPAYVVGGTPDPDGLSWFTVFKTRTVSVPPVGSPLNSQRQARSAIYVANYQATAGFTSTTTSEDAGGSQGDVPDLFQNVRAPDTNGVNHLMGDIKVPPVWYISGMSWNLDTGDVQSRFIVEGNPTSDLSTNSGIWTDSSGNHLGSFMGANSVSATSGNISSLDGQIAEVLFYKKALNGTEFDAVMNYLNTKFFVAAPGLIGDHNGDGKVDAADYVTWRKDPANNDGPQGYTDWRAHFGGPTMGAGGSVSASGVPEPTALVLFVLSVFGATLFGIRRRVA